MSESALWHGGRWSGRDQCWHVVEGQSSNGESAVHPQGVCVVAKKVNGLSALVVKGNRVVYCGVRQGCWR